MYYIMHKYIYNVCVCVYIYIAYILYMQIWMIIHIYWHTHSIYLYSIYTNIHILHMYVYMYTYAVCVYIMSVCLYKHIYTMHIYIFIYLYVYIWIYVLRPCWSADVLQVGWYLRMPSEIKPIFSHSFLFLCFCFCVSGKTSCCRSINFRPVLQTTDVRWLVVIISKRLDVTSAVRMQHLLCWMSNRPKLIPIFLCHKSMQTNMKTWKKKKPSTISP